MDRPDQLISVEIRCEQCDRTFGTDRYRTYREALLLLPALLTGWHAAHHAHAITFRVLSPEPLETTEADRLTITCLKTGCKRAHLETCVPIEMVGALTLVFHTGHEGHPIELAYGDRFWRTV